MVVRAVCAYSTRRIDDMSISEEYMKTVNGISRKKCKYLDGHTCPLKPSRASKGASCDGCTLLEKILFFKQLSLEMEEREKCVR